MGKLAVSGAAQLQGEPERAAPIPDDASRDAEIASLKANQVELWRVVRDHGKRFDTLQTAWWKRLWFRVDGWPGVRDLNAPSRSWRPWH